MLTYISLSKMLELLIACKFVNKNNNNNNDKNKNNNNNNNKKIRLILKFMMSQPD